MQLTIVFEWNDPRIQWHTKIGIGNWSFPTYVFYPIHDIWVPNFRLANCQSENCVVKPQQTLALEMDYRGRVEYESELVLRSTCDVDLTCTRSYFNVDVAVLKLINDRI